MESLTRQKTRKGKLVDSSMENGTHTRQEELRRKKLILRGEGTARSKRIGMECVTCFVALHFSADAFLPCLGIILSKYIGVMLSRYFQICALWFRVNRRMMIKGAKRI